MRIRPHTHTYASDASSHSQHPPPPPAQRAFIGKEAPFIGKEAALHAPVRPARAPRNPKLSCEAIGDAMAAPAYSKEEISALRGIFALYDPDGTGEISSGRVALA